MALFTLNTETGEAVEIGLNIKRYPVSAHKCKGCSCCQLALHSFGGATLLKPEDQYYFCYAGNEHECITNGQWEKVKAKKKLNKFDLDEGFIFVAKASKDEYINIWNSGHGLYGCEDDIYKYGEEWANVNLSFVPIEDIMGRYGNCTVVDIYPLELRARKTWNEDEHTIAYCPCRKTKCYDLFACAHCAHDQRVIISVNEKEVV